MRAGARLAEASLGAVLVALAAYASGLPRESDASLPDPPSAPQASRPSGPGAPEDAALARPEDVVPVASYTLVANLDPATHVVHGSGEIRFVNVSSRALDALWVHLYLNAFEDERTVFGRQHAGGFRGNAGLDAPGSIEVTKFFARELGRELFPRDPRTDGDRDDRTDIRVPLPKPLAPGETLTIETEFTSKLPAIVLRTGFADGFHMVAQWFPKIARLESDGSFAHFPFQRFSEFYADYGDYDVTVEVPRELTVGAVGALEEETTDGATKRLRFVQKGVHDFAFVAWDGFIEKTAEAEGVTVRCLVPRGYERAAEVELAAVSGGLREFGARYGAYPYAQLTVVHPPPIAAEAGGMEYPTLITTGGPAWLAALPVRPFEQVTLHELGHQWFYGLVATNENRWPFLDEGVTTYATSEVAEALYGEGEITSLVPLETAALDRFRAARVASHADVAAAAGDFATGSDYGALVYARTGTILRTIDRVWDGAAARAVSKYARRERFRHPGPDALERAIEEEGGEAARRFFHSAAFERGWVDFEPLPVANVARDEGGFVSEVVVRRAGTLVLPVEVALTKRDGSRELVTWDGEGDTHTFRVEGGSPVTAVRVDPALRVLIDDDKLDDGWVASPDDAAPRTRALAASLSFAALSAVLP